MLFPEPGQKWRQVGLVHWICSSSKEFSIWAGQGSSAPVLGRVCLCDGHCVLSRLWTHTFLLTLRNMLTATLTRVHRGAETLGPVLQSTRHCSSQAGSLVSTLLSTTDQGPPAFHPQR